MTRREQFSVALKRYAGCAAFSVIALSSIALAQIGPPGGSGCITNCTFTGTTTLGTGPAIITSPSAANLQHGAADAAAPVAQTIGVQNVVAGTSNTAGANWTFKGSAGTGTGAGGSLIFQVAPAGSTGTAQNALAAALTIDSTKLATFAGSITATGATLYVYAGNSTAILGSTGQGISSGLGLSNSSGISWNAAGGAQGGTTDTTLSRNAAGVVQFGTTAANASGSLLASAGTFSGLLTTSNTTDSTTTTTGALQSAGGLAVLKRVFFGGLTASSGLQTAVLCLSAGNEVIADSVACLASSEAFKESIAPSDMGLETVMALKPITYKYKLTGNERFDNAPNQRAVHAGFSAEQAALVDERLVAYDVEGKVRTVRTDAIPAALVKAVQTLKADNDNLRARLEKLETR